MKSFEEDLAGAVLLRVRWTSSDQACCRRMCFVWRTIEGKSAMPLYVAFFFRFLVSSVERERCTRCSADVYNEDHELRGSTDTRTEVRGSSQDVGLTRNRVRGVSVFFSFAKSGTASRVTATLQALAVHLAVRAFFPQTGEVTRRKIGVIPSVTDNRRNGELLNKLMTTKMSLVSSPDGVQRAASSLWCQTR